MIHKWVDRQSDTTLVLLHGTGGNELDLLELGQNLDPSANLLSLRGEVSEQGMNRFFKRHSHGVYDLESLANEAEKIVSFVQSKIKKDQNIVLVGFSNGANMAIWLLENYVQYFDKAILYAPMFPVELKQNNLSNTNVWLSYSEWDPIVPLMESFRVIERFERQNACVTVFKTQGHTITKEAFLKSKQWYENLNR